MTPTLDPGRVQRAAKLLAIADMLREDRASKTGTADPQVDKPVSDLTENERASLELLGAIQHEHRMLRSVLDDIEGAFDDQMYQASRQSNGVPPDDAYVRVKLKWALWRRIGAALTNTLSS